MAALTKDLDDRGLREGRRIKGDQGGRSRGGWMCERHDWILEQVMQVMACQPGILSGEMGMA